MKPLVAAFGAIVDNLARHPENEIILELPESALGRFLSPARSGRARWKLIGLEDRTILDGTSWCAFVRHTAGEGDLPMAKAALAGMESRFGSNLSATAQLFVALAGIEAEPLAVSNGEVEGLEASLALRVKRIERVAAWLAGPDCELPAPVAAHGSVQLADLRSGVLALEDRVRPEWMDSEAEVERARATIETWYRSSCEQGPESVEATTQLVGWLMRFGSESDEQLAQMIDGALTLDPHHAQALLLRAGLHLCRANEFDARRRIKEAIAYGGVSPGAAVECVARSIVDRAGASAVDALLLEAAEKTESPDLWFLYADHGLRQARGMRHEHSSPYAYRMASELPPLDLSEARARQLIKSF